MCHNCFHVRILSFFFSWFDRRNFFLAPLPLHRPPSWEEFQFFSNDNSRHRRVKRGSLWPPYGASLSLSLVYTRGNLFKLSLFPRLFPYTLYYILFLLSFPFLCRSRRIALVILVIKLVANLASLDLFVEM